MNTLTSQEFVLAFLSTCFEAGLSKEAAAEMLQKESVHRELLARPAFAEGYLSVMSEIPYASNAYETRNDHIEKSANALTKLLATQFIDVPKALYGVVKGTGRGGLSQIEKLRNSQFLKDNPFGVAVGTAATAGGIGYGANKWINRDATGMPARPIPIYGPSAHSPQGYADYMKDTFDTTSRGVLEHNKEHFGGVKRRRELERAINSGQTVDGYGAYQEYQGLDRKFKRTSKDRNRLLTDLERYGDQNRSLAQDKARRAADLENQRTAWWAAPRRWMARASGQKPREYFDRKIGEVQAQRSAAQTAAELADKERRLLWSGQDRLPDKALPTSADLQRQYFPQYR
jgi:hypothetical protein